ncbi:N-acetylmuramoyl-L-alanine amidase [Flavobacterium beibuense]|uniref:N-acetylmuramoyl-L-alanine amidase n=1 Tax=Flavobacterium beibuense TaxID=657326 RepID=A0A444W9C8_9FLAO|nr:N-acetylmuramoyl-L-alanine amidase [Flavobacterium beibuense]RYJ42509.1 Cell wall hydrolase/autolysin [Flavobacterium beibuense]
MKGNTKKKLRLLLFLMVFTVSFGQDSGKFKVVLDAGHGGKDYGAMYNGFIEKNIALDVTLRVGKILEKESDIQVIYTRKTDVFIELKERPKIANKADANLFVSIHCNAETKKTAHGAETFIMGLTKNASNLEVAKMENAVWELEDDKTSYAGFDPNKPESLLKFQLMQEEYRGESFAAAVKVQHGLAKDLKRNDRGVKDAPFWVLHGVAMPGILIELGFLSFKSEGEYLNSEKGKTELAEAVARGIIEFKKENFTPLSSISGYVKPAETTTPKTETPKESPAAQTAKDGAVFKVQIAAGSSDLATTPSNFKGLNNISKEKDGKVVKYYYGEVSDYNEAQNLLSEAKAKGYKDAFVVAFKNGKKISVNEALKGK